MSEACSRNDSVERDVGWLLWRVPMLGFIVGAFVTPPARLLPGGTIAACAVEYGRGKYRTVTKGPSAWTRLTSP